MNAHALGRAGEESAALYLKEHGYTILARNVRINHFEIDIIAKNQTHLIFAEVKTRRTRPHARAPFGRPADAVDARKRACLIAAVRTYWKEHRDAFPTLTPNIDILEVYVDPNTDAYRVLAIYHYPNAVTG